MTPSWSRQAPAPKQRSAIPAIWLAYVGGATGAAYALARLGVWCLAFPLGALVALAALA